MDNRFLGLAELNITATSQVSGRGQISTPRCSETFEPISMKLGIYNYFSDVTTDTNPYNAATRWTDFDNAFWGSR